MEPPLGRFEVGARVVELPKDLLAERVLTRPSALSGQLDALVWVIPAKPDADWSGPLGELWLFPAGADAKKLLALPGWMPSGPGCIHTSRLALVGTTTAAIDVVAKCERSLPQRTPIRALAMVTLGSAPAFLLGLRIAEAAVDEAFTVTPLMADRDGDGREDPSFRVDFDLPASQTHATAELGWLDRTAGLSVDEGRLGATLEPTFLTWEAALGKKPKLYAVLSDIATQRRLLSSLCQQSATSRIFDWRGEALRCPSMAQVASRLARIEVKAALGLADPLEAAHALAFSTSWHGGIAAVEREDLRKRISKSMGQVRTGLPVPTSVRPVVSAESVRYSPLLFEGDGTSLLVQVDRGGLERVSLNGTSVAVDADAGLSAWPLAVTAPDGRLWSTIVPACDRSELSFAVKASNGQFLPLVPTRLLAPRPGPCKNPTNWPIATGPIHWQGDNPVAVLDGVCWAGPGTHPCPSPDKLGPIVKGSPRSPDGRRLVVVTSLGPVVIGGPRPELWSGAGLDGKRLSDCVVANDAKAIACVANGGLLLVTRPEPIGE